MLQRHMRMARSVARDISEAANGAFDAYIEGRVEEEPQITDRILGAVEGRVAGQKYNGVSWKARTLRTGRGSAAEEKRHGADLMGVLDIDLPEYRVKKGFLAQAKKANPDRLLQKYEWERMIEQCKKMMELTPDSFIFVYPTQPMNVYRVWPMGVQFSWNIRIFPANAVLGLRGRFEMN